MVETSAFEILFYLTGNRNSATNFCFFCIVDNRYFSFLFELHYHYIHLTIFGYHISNSLLDITIMIEEAIGRTVNRTAVYCEPFSIVLVLVETHISDTASMFRFKRSNRIR